MLPLQTAQPSVISSRENCFFYQCFGSAAWQCHLPHSWKLGNGSVPPRCMWTFWRLPALSLRWWTSTLVRLSWSSVWSLWSLPLPLQCLLHPLSPWTTLHLPKCYWWIVNHHLRLLHLSIALWVTHFHWAPDFSWCPQTTARDGISPHSQTHCWCHRWMLFSTQDALLNTLQEVRHVTLLSGEWRPFSPFSEKFPADHRSNFQVPCPRPLYFPLNSKTWMTWSVSPLQPWLREDLCH